MRIALNAHLLSSQAGYRSAGIHSYIDNLLRRLPAAAPQSQFTALVGTSNQTDYDGIAIRRSRWDTASPLRRILWEQFAQPSQLADFDLYHALAFVAPLKNALPSVVTVYDLSFIHYPQVLSPARRLYLRLFTGMTCRRARRVIAISHSTARDVQDTLAIPSAKIDVAAPGYNREKFKPLPAEQVAAFRQQKGLPERFLLFVGTLEPRKNLPTLLEAYAALPGTERIPLLLGGGKGWQYDDIFATIERCGLDSDVHFLGFVPAEELTLWYNSAEIFVFPSVFEGFGLPILEAMACGTPVIVSDASSLTEVASGAGMCLPPHDVAAWTAALHQALTDTSWRQESSANGIRQAARYDWNDTAQKTVASYHRALDVTL